MTEQPALRRRLEEAADGLVYTSESDRPFEWVCFPGAGALWPMSAGEFAALVGAALGAPVEERTLEHFFERHTDNVDPYDTESRKLRPRYRHLRDTLRQALAEVRVFRVGTVEIDCYVVGGDGEGNVAGLRTVAIET